jgi:Na+-driven multidrug efflux pump
MAAFTVGVRIENYTLIPIVSFNMGMAILPAQNIAPGISTG